MLQAAKYLIYDFTFTFSFLFICSRLNWALFNLSGIFACERNDGQDWNFHLKYLDVEKNERQSSEILNDIAPPCSYCIVHCQWQCTQYIGYWYLYWYVCVFFSVIYHCQWQCTQYTRCWFILICLRFFWYKYHCQWQCTQYIGYWLPANSV